MPTIADDNAFAALVSRLASSMTDTIQPPPGDARQWALIGIRSRGDDLARRLAEQLPEQLVQDRVGSLDITLYRDDLSEIGPRPVVRETDIPFAIDDLHILLVDDVMMTGRSVRAALQSLMDLGRPARIYLAVLVDRGGRELPIVADFCALAADDPQLASLSPEQQVQVLIKPTDDRDAITVTSPRSAPEAAA